MYCWKIKRPPFLVFNMHVFETGGDNPGGIGSVPWREQGSSEGEASSTTDSEQDGDKIISLGGKVQ